MAKHKDSYIPKEIEKEVPKESLPQLEIFYKLLEDLNEVADIKNVSSSHITDEGNREHFKLFGQKVLELKHQLNIFLPNYVKELKGVSGKGSHSDRFASKKVIERFLANTSSEK